MTHRDMHANIEQLLLSVVVGQLGGWKPFMGNGLQPR